MKSCENHSGEGEIFINSNQVDLYRQIQTRESVVQFRGLLSTAVFLGSERIILILAFYVEDSASTGQKYVVPGCEFTTSDFFS